MGDVDVTELTELDARKVAGVTTPANGTPFLMVKGSSEDAAEDCPTCKGKGTIRGGNVKCPDCNGTGNLTKAEASAERQVSAEADAEEEEVTGSASKEADEWEALDKALSAADRAKMPASSFAYIDAKGGKHLPVHDEGHTIAAKGRLSSQDFSGAKGDAGDAKAKAAAKIAAAAKKFGIGDAAKGDVQDALGGTNSPVEGGHLDTGSSGLAGAVTAGLGGATRRSDSSLVTGGETTSSIPDVSRVSDNPPVPATTDSAGILEPQSLAKAEAVTSLLQALDQIAAGRDKAVKDGATFAEPTPEQSETPGNMPWESYDAATLRQVAECLAGCCAALDNLADRERTEARVADGDDLSNAWDLEEAKTALEYALGVAARLSYHEAAEGEATKGAEEYAAKVGRTLSGKNTSALVAARDHLSAVIDGARNLKAGKADESEEDNIVTTVTKGELAEAIIAGVQTAMKAEREEQAAAAKTAEETVAAEEAAKNANNGGDVSTADVHANGQADADDVNAVGGKVNSEYVNKGADGEESPVMKGVVDSLASLAKQLASVEETVAKLAKRPRPGGPALTGTVPGLEEATKAADDEIGTLEKALEAATDPAVKDNLGLRLTHAKLRKMHEDGTL